MHEETPPPPEPGASKFSPLANWPRYPGGAIAGALIGVAAAALFFIGFPSLSSVLPVALMLAVVLLTLRSLSRDV